MEAQESIPEITSESAIMALYDALMRELKKAEEAYKSLPEAIKTS